MKLNVTENRDTFKIYELLAEGKELELKARLLGYKAEKIETPNNACKPKLSE